MFYRVKVAPNSKHASSRRAIRSALHIVACWLKFVIAGLAVCKKKKKKMQLDDHQNLAG